MGNRFTEKDLRSLISEMNERHPLKEKNGYGTYDRFHIYKAYGNYGVHRLIPGSTGARDCVSLQTSAREAANKFVWYMLFDFVED